MLRSFLSLLWLLPAVASAGSDNWLTIAGDPARADVNTIQFDPASIARVDRLQTMAVRVSRSTERVNGDGIRFRSFVGTVEFDCKRLTARFATTQFYDAPLWHAPSRAVVYPPSDYRPMAFRGIEPNPRDRLIQAACGRSSTSDAGPPGVAR